MSAGNIKINARLFGNMKQYAPEGGASFSMTLKINSEVSAVLKELKIPSSKEKTILILIDGRRVDINQTVEDGASLVIFPPIEGG